jgi:hypothetical protein
MKIIETECFGSEKQACTGKKRYTERTKAMNVIKDIYKKHLFLQYRPKYYKCKYCEGWHVTGNKKNKNRR